MFNPERLFENFFDDPRITAARLSNYAADTISRFGNANANGVYTATIDSISTAHTAFIGSLSGIDTAKGVLKGKTQTVVGLMIAFGNFMSEYEGEIAHAVGGFNSAAYWAFYPHGVSEYSAATITDMPLLVKRVNTLATDHATELGITLAQQLQLFENQWISVRSDQATVKHDLTDGRASRGPARRNLETALLKAVYTVALQFTGDATKCTSFFDFGLLTGVSRKADEKVAPKG